MRFSKTNKPHFRIYQKIIAEKIANQGCITNSADDRLGAVLAKLGLGAPRNAGPQPGK